MKRTLDRESEPTRFDAHRRPCDGARFLHRVARVTGVFFALGFVVALVSASPVGVAQGPDGLVLPLFITPVVN